MKRKARRHSKPPRFKRNAAADTALEALACCDNLAAMGGLLAACNCAPFAAPIEPIVVSRAGSMIAAEAEKLSAMIEELDSALAKAARRS